MTNFDFLLSDPQFTTFREMAVSAEKIYDIDPVACVLNCCRCVEFAVKWITLISSIKRNVSQKKMLKKCAVFF